MSTQRVSFTLVDGQVPALTASDYVAFEVRDWKVAHPIYDDRMVIDGLVNGVAQMAEWGSAGSTWIEKYVVYAGLNVIGFGNHLAARQGRKLQSGMVHHYAAIIIAGLFLLALVVQLILQM